LTLFETTIIYSRENPRMCWKSAWGCNTFFLSSSLDVLIVSPIRQLNLIQLCCCDIIKLAHEFFWSNTFLNCRVHLVLKSVSSVHVIYFWNVIIGFFVCLFCGFTFYLLSWWEERTVLYSFYLDYLPFEERK